VGFYVDTDDIKQHMKGANAVGDETIDEIMTEQEYYVQTKLGLTTLPPANPLLANIIRDLTVAHSIYALTAPTSGDMEKADTIRREAHRRLNEVNNDIGLGIMGGATPTSAEEEVGTLDGSFFHLDDFDQYHQLGWRNDNGPTVYVIRPANDGNY
jgi:hypothetical protein